MKMLFVLLTMLCFNAYADKARIEEWKKGKTLKYVVRDEDGLFVSHGTLKLESWNDGDNSSEWIGRRKDGTLVTGKYQGVLEKFKVKSKGEQLRLVIRNKDGQFVTWYAMDKLITAGFERMDTDKDGDKETVYVLRYKGQFVNWAKAKLETWKNFDNKVLVVRDTQDDDNNGKLLAWIAPEETKKGQLVYRDHESGQFLSTNE